MLLDRLDRSFWGCLFDGAGEVGGEAVEVHGALQRLDLGRDVRKLLLDGRVRGGMFAGPFVRGIGGGHIEQLRLCEFVVERMLPGGDLRQCLVDPQIATRCTALGPPVAHLLARGFVARGGRRLPFAVEVVEPAVDSRDGLGQAGAAHFFGGGRGGGMAG